MSSKDSENVKGNAVPILQRAIVTTSVAQAATEAFRTDVRVTESHRDKGHDLDWLKMQPQRQNAMANRMAVTESDSL